MGRRQHNSIELSDRPVAARGRRVLADRDHDFLAEHGWLLVPNVVPPETGASTRPLSGTFELHCCGCPSLMTDCPCALRPMGRAVARAVADTWEYLDQRWVAAMASAPLSLVQLGARMLLQL